jgi:hypothetical protein
MIFNIIEEITRNHTDLDLIVSAVFIQKGVICRIQADSFHKSDSISASNLPQSEFSPATNDHANNL